MTDFNQFDHDYLEGDELDKIDIPFAPHASEMAAWKAKLQEDKVSEKYVGKQDNMLGGYVEKDDGTVIIQNMNKTDAVRIADAINYEVQTELAAAQARIAALEAERDELYTLVHDLKNTMRESVNALEPLSFSFWESDNKLSRKIGNPSHWLIKALNTPLALKYKDRIVSATPNIHTTHSEGYVAFNTDEPG